MDCALDWELITYRAMDDHGKETMILRRLQRQQKLLELRKAARLMQEFLKANTGIARDSHAPLPYKHQNYGAHGFSCSLGILP